MAASVSLGSETTSLKRRLPEGWSVPESVEDVIEVDGHAIRRAGIASVAPDGEEITGSAAALESPFVRRAAPSISPGSRAWLELIERVSTVEAMRREHTRFELLTADETIVGACDRVAVFPDSSDPSAWRHARSNGVAVHLDWQRACERALWELAERDRILASWYGHVRPERIDAVPFATAAHDWSAWAFPAEAASFSREIEVVGVFGFPRADGLPLAIGYAARPEREHALDDATREAIQLLAFVWGEPPVDASASPPPTAMGHLDFYQDRRNHDLLRSWLRGEHARFVAADGRGNADSRVMWIDLTPGWVEGELRVAKAVCPAAWPLVFGESPFVQHLPKARRIHPIS